MKPSWDKAPRWAGYVAQDRDGSWWWYEFKPAWSIDRYICAFQPTSSRFKRAVPAPRKKKGELEKRP